MKRSDHTPKAMLAIAILLLLVGVLFPFVPAGEGLTFNSDTNVVKDSRNQANYDIASVGIGETADVYVVYEDYSLGSDPHVFFHRSATGGRTWQEPFDFMPADPIALDKHISPAIDVYSDGSTTTIAVVYMDSTYREITNLVEWVIIVRTSTNNGSSWSADKLVTPTTSVNYPSDEIKDPAIAFDPYGNLFVTWTSLSGDDRINIAYSTDFGDTWSGIDTLPSHSLPEKPDYDHRISSVASDGQYVVVTWFDINKYREVSYYSRAQASSLSGYPSLSFSEPERIATTTPYDYQTWYPKVVADTTAFHMVWWDFFTDPGGANNYPNINTDRPSVKYVRSTDHGATWSINGKKNIILNTSDPEGWHSAPDIDLGSDGTLAVTWMDYTLNKPNIFVTASTDNGASWSKPARANDHYPDIYREGPMVALDDGGDVHAIWTYREDVNADWDLNHASSVVDGPPEAVDDLNVLIVDERYAMVGWTSNREPDFKRYWTFISENESFALPSDLSSLTDDDKFPETPYYNYSKNQLMNLEVFSDIEPDTTYYAKLAIEDQGGFISESNEVTFTTRPVNKPPEFVKPIPTLYMEEDTPVEGILNLTDWRSRGWIWDDVYNGYPQLTYFIESKWEEPNVTVSIRKEGISPAYYLLDIYPGGIDNYYGDNDMFRIGVQDAGKDGGIGTPDDRIGYSNWFTVQVNSTNDLPVWKSFYDLNSDVSIPLTSGQSVLRVSKQQSGALEDIEYQFKMTARDVDQGDNLKFNCSDPRVVVTVDTLDVKYSHIFTITPDNDDVPELNMTIFVWDPHGGERSIQVFIYVENINGAPEFTKVNGVDVPKSGGSVDFEIAEQGVNSTVTFQVEGYDEDYGDELTLSSISDRPSIQKLGPFRWNVTVTANKDDAIEGFISFGLDLWDKQRSDLAILIVNFTVKNVQDSPENLKVSVAYNYDQEDENEWNNDRIQAEWDEPVDFKATATDPDGDELTYTWRFKNENSGEEFTMEGSSISVRFIPSSGNLTQTKSEKFLINLTVSDGKSASRDIYHYREEWVFPDPDNDNDGMPDNRELFFFGDLSQEPDYDYDFDTYANVVEIGFGIPQFPSEKRSPYSVDRTLMDPTNKDVNPFEITQGDDDEGGDDGEGLPIFLIILITVVVLAVSGVVGGIIVIMRIQKKKEEEEEEDIEKRVQQMEERQKTLQGLYGVQKAGDIVGPDQSTLDDLQLDLGGQVYHEEGKGGFVGEGKKEELVSNKKEKEESSGPQWESTGGPVFEDGAPGLEFGHSLELDSMEDIQKGNVDESKLEDTMGDLMNAADDFDEESVKNAGGNVLIGAVPMEEQIKQMQGQQGTGGPRNPPPGQAPPEQGMPPQQAPPQPGQGLPPARLQAKKPDQE